MHRGQSMKFELERQLTPIVVEWLVSQGLDVKGELRTAWGICDLVACELDLKSVRTRHELRQTAPIATPLRAEIFGLIPAEPTTESITEEQIFQRFGNSLETLVRKEIEHLVRGRYIFRTTFGTLYCRNNWRPIHRQLIELKLRNVNEAIEQALNNRSFADQSYIAVPHDVAARSRIRLKKKFEESGVGLIGVSDSCEVLIEPGPSATDVALQLVIADRFWASTSNNAA
jgi:hypothetical protein